MTIRKQILDALQKAEALIVGDSPLLGFFPIFPNTDDSDDGKNLVLKFTWEDEGLEYSVVIPESSLDKATLKPDGYNLEDKDGKIVALASYLLQPLWKKEE
jgi:hypothetical protein